MNDWKGMSFYELNWLFTNLLKDAVKRCLAPNRFEWNGTLKILLKPLNINAALSGSSFAPNYTVPLRVHVWKTRSDHLMWNVTFF